MFEAHYGYAPVTVFFKPALMQELFHMLYHITCDKPLGHQLVLCSF